MTKLLNTLICILFTSPLAAFDITLDGVEFGQLQMSSTASEFADGTNFLSQVLTLNEGDVLQVLRFTPTRREFSYVRRATDTGNLIVRDNTTVNYDRIYVTCGDVTTTVTVGYVVGPAIIQVGLKFGVAQYDNETWTFSYSRAFYSQLDYAILRNGASTQSSYVTIPSNPSGNFEVKLQTSSDLQTWSPTTPGVFPYGDNAKFFRLVVE